MKRYLALILLFALAGCIPSPAETLVPVDTVVAQTMAALSTAATPLVTPTDTPAPPPTPVEELPSDEIPISGVAAQCVPTTTERIQARVVRILDGTTIEVAISNDVYTVRYIGVQAPFLSDGLIGAESADVNKKLVGSQVVTLVRDVSDADEEGRLLRYVLVGDTFVNFEMARTGYAKAVNTPPDQACLGLILAAENEARRTVVGVWAPTLTPTPTPRPTRTPTPIGGVPPTPEPACNCRGKPLKCKNFFNHAEAQACYDYCFALGLGDVFGLDKDGDGRVCEGLP